MLRVKDTVRLKDKRLAYLLDLYGRGTVLSICSVEGVAFVYWFVARKRKRIPIKDLIQV